MSQIMALAASLGVTERDLQKQLYHGHVTEAEVVSAARLLGGAWAGNEKLKYAVNEALTTSDLFVDATGAVMDRELLAAYQALPRQWAQYSTRTTVNDFRPKTLIDLIGGTGRLPDVPEHSHYPVASQSGEARTIQVSKVGEQFGYTFEMRINDQLGELKRVPATWADKAVAAEDYVTLKQLANPLTGVPNASFFSAGNSNTGTLSLTTANLQTTISAVKGRTLADGTLLAPGPLQLVVGPVQEFTARQIINATEVRTTETSPDRTLVAPNPFAGVGLVVLDNLPGDAWFVMPKPGTANAACYTAFLSGFEQPDIRVKRDQGSSAAGDLLPVDAGSFDDDTIYWRVRHITGAATGDPRFAYAQNPA